ncbi:MAG: hypothetical protein ACRDWD_05135 [Acidimicrobiia bacterium]
MVATVVSALVALGIAGPLIYRALDDSGGGGSDNPTAAGSEPGGGGNGASGGAGADGDGGLPPTPGGEGGTGVGGAGGATQGGTGEPAPEPPTSPADLPPGGDASTTTTTTTTTTKPPVQPKPVLLVSKEATRVGAVPLDGAQLGGLVYAFVVDANRVTDTADFFWDDPDMKGRPFSTDPEPAFDFCGTDVAGLAIPFNTLAVPNGSHEMTVRVTSTEDIVVAITAKLEVKNIIPPKEPPPVCGRSHPE